jgi:pyrroloquinoline quinone biosynthesis protein B
MRLILLSIFFLVFANALVSAQKPYILVLGTAQDGGFPQAGCKKSCCRSVWENRILHQGVSSLALVDPISNQKWIFDATPDFPEQLHLLNNHIKSSNPLDGIFLTHAHIGHYSGLMHLGREVMGSSKIKVFAMPKMKYFLENNGPWSQLVNIQNIEIRRIEEAEVIVLNERLKVMPFTVPHRDEFSETVGYKIMTKDKSLIFIPDIDKWQKWDKNLVDIVKENDFLLLDGTFYKDGEITRPMSEVPHPFISETVELLSDLPKNEKNKVKFIHLNHTNPILQPKSKERKDLRMKGFAWVETDQKIEL